jgi:cytochrome c-type biogenesis protein CcmH
VRRVAAILVAAVALAAPVAQAAEPRTSLSDIEDEVMCPVCGVPLQLADNAPQAERERAYIERLIAQGKTKQQIKDALVAQFGSEVLATPDDSGFDLAAWIVPGLAILAALAGVALAARRWRRGRSEPATAAGPALDPAESKRLEDDLERYEL